MNIIREGVRGALTKIVRLIIYTLIVLILCYVIGLISSRKASALVLKDAMWDPDMSNLNWSYVFGSQNASASHDYWFSYAWYNNTDYDLMGFRLNKNTAQMQDWSTFDNEISNFYTLQGILWSTDGIGHPCYNSGEWLDTFFCPIDKGSTYNRFTLMVYVFDPIAQENLELQTTLERNKYLVNYESTDIIKAMEDTGVMTIVQGQEETNHYLEETQDIISEQNDYLQDDSTTGVQTDFDESVSDLSEQFDDMLNGWGGEWSTLTRVILEPINTIMYALDDDTTCSPIRLTIPYINSNEPLELPCMSTIYSTYFRTLLNMFIMVISGLYCYRTIMYVIRTIKGTIDPMDDRIEVVEL